MKQKQSLGSLENLWDKTDLELSDGEDWILPVQVPDSPSGL